MSFASASKRSRFAYQHLAASLLSDGSERFGKVIESAVHAKPAEKDYFSDANLRILFECGVNTPANWRRGKSPPEGFTDAFLKRDYKAMQLCAERYKANRAKSDAMNSKRLVRNMSEEQINRESL